MILRKSEIKDINDSDANKLFILLWNSTGACFKDLKHHHETAEVAQKKNTPNLTIGMHWIKMVFLFISLLREYVIHF